MTTAVSIQIPPDAEPGDTIKFSINGQNLEMEVPLGSRPGDVLQVELGCENDSPGMQEGNENVTEIQMSTGETLVFHSEIPVRQTDFAIGASDGTHAMIWPAGKALVDFINTDRFLKMLREYNICSILELGSGLGLCGMVFGFRVSKVCKPGAVQVTLSDMPSAIPLLDFNVKQNSHLLSSNFQIATAPLVWHSYPVSQFGSNLDWIIGSDLLYNPSNIAALVSTIQRLSSASTRLLLSVRWRKPALERAFFMHLSDKINWRLIDGPCPLSWREYGNPASQSSNQYFVQTMVAVQGQPIPLACIDESATEKMSELEFEAWEKLQTQIYLGEVISLVVTEPMTTAKRQRL